MKVSFYLYSRQPLGRLLDRILAACERAALGVRQTLLTSRQRREDLPRDEILRSAAASASDSCEIVTDAGELGLAWLYGSRRNVPRLWGTLSISEKELGQLKLLLKELCAAAGVTYGVCDIEATRMASMRSEPDTYELDGVVSAFHALYWWNYFGLEYREQLPVTEGVRAAVAEVDGGGLVVITRRSPEDPTDPERVAALSREWPVFRKYDRKAGFRTPVRIDYSQVWELPAPVSKEGPVRDLVGPPDEFIAAVASHTARFHEWATSKGVQLRTEEDFLNTFQEHEQIIRDELLIPAIAAYGEMVRAKLGGAWRKAILMNRGEPVVVKPGRPWTTRRVILEVLEGLEPVEV